MHNSIFAVLCLALLAQPAAAEFPYPQNPLPCAVDRDPPNCIANSDFARYAFVPATSPLTLPNDFNDDWKLTSTTTGEVAIDSSPQELFGVKGASVDLAWQVSTGRPDVLIAVLDSGIRWQDRLTDLVNKFHLNRGELPAPEGSTNSQDAWDRNGDGVFNVRDYLADATHAQDSRVSDQNGNNLIDPEDLIFLFSDGSDADHNGYIDDICGWDFFEDDNDALDEVRYGHGTGESEDSGAEANNADDGVGTCPNCMLLPLRVGDSFVAEINNFGQAVLYAVDSGASVVQEALGALNNTSFAQAAVDYAYRHGVTVIASAADEESNHHNYPANYHHTVEVNSVTRFLTAGELQQTPHSYLYLNGCTNYGGHIAVTVPSSSCSSEATGRSSGMAGLIYSAARNEIDRGNLQPYPSATDQAHPTALSANEVKQLLTQTADDINFDPNYETMTPFPGVQMSQRFPSIAGWDQYFGYGRVNANAALRRVAQGKIPPEADITAPEWYETLVPGDTLTIAANVAAVRSTSYSYRVELAPGIQPAESAFEAIAMGTGSQPQSLQAQVSFATLIARMPHGAEGPAIDASGQPDPDRFTVTARVRVTDQQGNVGEDRRVFAVHLDPDLKNGHAIRIGGDGVASPVLADVDNNGVLDVLLATSDGVIHAFSGGLSHEVPGWPVHTDDLDAHATAPGFLEVALPHTAVLGRVAVGDLDANGELEIVVGDVHGQLYVWNSDGSRRVGFPVRTLPEYSNTWRSERDLTTPAGLVPDRINRHAEENRLARGIGSGPALANLDGSADGSLEIIAGAWDRHVYAWHRDGTLVHGWPVMLKDPAKVATVDPISNDVTLKSNANARLGTKIITSPSIGDIDGDGKLDVVSGVNEEYVENPNAYLNDLTISLYRAGGILTSGNGRLYAMSRDGTASGSHGIEHGWNPDAFLPGWPVKVAMLTTKLLPFVGSGINGSPALADVNGDGRSEIGIFSFIGPAYIFDGTGSSFLGNEPARPGTPRTLAANNLGSGSNSIDKPAFPGLGGGVLVPFAGAGNGYHFIAPTAGLGKLIDNNIPADQIPSENQLGAWTVADAAGAPADGKFLPAFPRVVNDLQFLTTPSVADIDNDGLPEALEGSGVYDVHAFDIEGREPVGWPKFTNGWTVTSPAVGDIDGDGKLDVVSATREGWLYHWTTSGDECSFAPWPMAHHDARSTGNEATDSQAPGVPRSITGAASMPGGLISFQVLAVPGDDLFCGAPAQFDVRYSTSPIASEAEFTAATPLSVLAAPSASGRNSSGTLALQAPSSFVPGQVHVAGRSSDASANRSPLFSLGVVTLEALPTATASATATASSTRTPTLVPTATQTAVPTATATSTLTRTISPTSTPSTVPPANDDGGCAMTPRSVEDVSLGYVWLPLAIGLIYRRRRS